MASKDFKRRLINQLPAVHQTDTLKNFFAATVDNLFQPGTSEAISGYVGQKPIYYDASKDFYISEPTKAREAYQLEPAMTSKATDGSYTHSLCYDDLINYLQSQGAHVSNHSRLFEGEYYSWAPPVDLDKLNNYLQYYWMGSLTDEESEKSVITLRAPRAVETFGGGAAEFKMPPALAQFGNDAEERMVLVNGVLVDANFVEKPDGLYAVISSIGLSSGDVVETIRYGDLAKVINGRETLQLYPFIAWSSTLPKLNSSDDYIADLPRHYNVGDLTYVGDSLGNGKIYRCVSEHDATATFDREEWIEIFSATYATTGMRVRLVDGLGPTVDTARYFLFDGVGTSILLSPDYSSHNGGRAAHYVVIDRRSKENSPWARRNMWVHKSSLEWTGAQFSDRQAQRPIIEFLPHIELYNYGTRRLPDVQGTLSGITADVVDHFGLHPWDDSVWDEEKIVLSRINGQFFARMSNDGAAGDTVLGSVVVDNGYVLKPNDYVFVNQPISPEPELNKLIYKVVSNPDTPLPSGARADVIELVLAGEPKRGDIFRINPQNEDSVFADQVEYWYDGEKWTQCASAADAPLFMLYDANQNSLADINAFPGTDFTGSKLFSYKVGSGAADSVLGFPISYNPYGQPIFEINPIIERVNYVSGEVSGYYYHRFIDTDRFSNNWFPVETPSSQQLVEGVYQIPLNLQANPGNLEIEEISRNQWFDHFSAVMRNQDGFVGHPYSINNWRDTKKELGTGNSILQHRAPLLKTMLIASDLAFDLPAAIRYTEQEYIRFRNRFVQTLIDLRSEGTLLDTDAPSAWVDRILVQLRLNKSGEFPFAYSGMAGGPYFIPPTPAFLGLSQVAVPKLIVDTAYASPVNMLRGHDGSMTPAFAPYRESLTFAYNSDLDTEYDLGTQIGPFDTLTIVKDDEGVVPFAEYEVSVEGRLTFRAPQTTTNFVVSFSDLRDTLLLALEERIYENIDDDFKTEARPVFDLSKYVGGRFFKGDYTAEEIDRLLGPAFERWAQQNRFDYRANDGYVAGEPFTWNYSATLDRYGLPLPGNWRGIYRLYFDTDRPHLTPWEMLGFIDKPVWWDGQYGPAPYTSGNTKLWDDLRDGRIRDGARAGIDPRYARPELYDVLPVDEEGDLMDPVAAKIVEDLPTYQQASAPWKMGDHSPVENLWRNSASFGFAMALAGFLAKPARFVEQGWDTINNVQDTTGQYIFKPTGNRPLNKDVYVHGEIGADGETRVIAVGVQQWITDYMRSKGQDPVVFGNAIRGLEVTLAHKMAGFTTLDSTRVMADNFGLIPAEDVVVELYRSPSIREEVYSGVLVEWTGRGWRVIGYDTRTPEFKIILPEVNGPKGAISLANAPEPVVTQWRPNTYYPTGTNALYQETVYKAKKGHLSGPTFDAKFWDATGLMPPQAPRVVTYLRGTGEVATIPYGTTFNSYQEVADFLLGYQRYLVSRGWVFDTMNSEGTVLDWYLMTREFLEWAQVQWEPGNFITLSPSAAGLKFETDHGMIMDVLTSINGAYGLLDRTGLPIDRRNAVVNRIDGQVTLFSKNSDLYGARINVSEIEHVLFFNNQTIFSDIIYSPVFNLRQPRLRIIGRRSTDWTGRLDAPGFMLIDNEIKANFVKQADDLVDMFDIERADNVVLRDHARHVIGYDSRDYLSSLVLSEVEQFEFYQGMIHQKGAPGSFDKLLRSDFIEQSRDLKFFEEWAFKIDEFGAVQTRDRLAFLFGQSALNRDPQLVHFRTGTRKNNGRDWIELFDDPNSGLDPLWIDRPRDPLHTFPQRADFNRQEDDLPVSGYVRTTEATYAAYDMNEALSLYDAANNAVLATGETLWVHSTPRLRDVFDEFNARWWLLGNKVEGFWDGTVNQRQLDESYVATNAEGDVVFRSKAGEAPFITFTSNFTPVAGHTYRAAFAVRKISKETNGVASYLRPAFDAFKATGGTIDGGLGLKSGNGFDPISDVIDTTDWKLGEWHDVEVEWTCPAAPAYSTARGRLRVNRAYPGDDKDTTFSNAIFEVKTQTFTVQANEGWDLFRSYNLSADGKPNTVSRIETIAEDNTIVTTRIFPVRPHGLTATDIGSAIIIAGATKTEPEIEGIQIISSVADNYFEVFTTGKDGHDFVGNNEVGPELRILRSHRFANLSAFNAFKNTQKGLQTGDMAYVDGVPWKVYKLTTVSQQQDDYDQTDGVYVDPPTQVNFWELYRTQPKRMDATRLASSLLYNLKTKVTDTDLQPEPLALGHLNVLAPLTGQVVGLAESEIDFKLSYDPAVYDTGEAGPWGAAQIGRVWWDLSTVRFLETETDNVIFGYSEEARYTEEVEYRTANWGKIAPGTSVDIYEWVRSRVPADEYSVRAENDTTGLYVGEVYRPDAPKWIEVEEFDPETGANATFYYFWVKGRDFTPAVSFRKNSTVNITNLIKNPLLQDVPWIAPVLPNALLVGGVSFYLDDPFEVNNGVVESGTVLQVEVENEYDGVQHDEWILLRPKDERSLPPDWLWDKMRDSLVGFDDSKTQTPYIVQLPEVTPPVNQAPVWQINPPAPVFPLYNTLPSTANSSSQVGETYDGDNFLAQIYAIDPEGADVSYVLVEGSLPLGITYDPATGVLSGTASLDHIGGGELMGDYTWTFGMQATDGVTYSPTQKFSITVKHLNKPPVWITPAGQVLDMWEGNAVTNIIPEGFTFRAYDPEWASIEEANAALIYSLRSGTLPGGLTLQSNGALTGSVNSEVVPKAGSTFTFTVGVKDTDPNQAFVDRQFSIRVRNVNKGPQWTTAAGSLGAVNEKAGFNFQVQATDPDTDAVTYSFVGSAPAWLSLNASTGALTGTAPDVATSQTYNFTIRASDGALSSDRAFSISVGNVNNAPIWSTSSGSLGTISEGSSFSRQLAAPDPDGQPVSFSIVSGSLPSGMSMSSSGMISGTAPNVSSNQTYSFTVRASDGSLSADRSFSITVTDIPNNAPQWITPAGVLINQASGSNGQTYVNQSFQFQLSATDPDGSSLTYSGSMPPGLSLSSSGLITGTILSNTAQSFTVGVSDGITTVTRAFFVNPSAVPSGEREFASSGDFTVPTGVSSITLNWVIGGGGGGGGGHQTGYGGGGGGGGSGGVQQGSVIAVSGGDVIHVDIGAGGFGSLSNGGAGGATVVYKNGVAVASVAGGQGGAVSPNTGKTFLYAPGGAAGPGGNNGADGPPGNNDYASSYGGAGGAGPMPGSQGGPGGDPYAGPTGGNGIGYGSGGGGGGARDRVSPYSWSGGNGVSGYVKLSY